MKKVLFLTAVVVLVLMVPLLVFGQQKEKAKAWKPKKEVSVVVPSAPGGGSDLNARTIAAIVLENKLAPVSLMIENKPGGSGAVAFSQVFTSKGDPNTLMILHSGQVMGSYVNDWDVKAEMLTYVATLAFDELLLGVKADGPYKNIEGLLAAIKEKPESIKFGGSQRGNSDHLSFELLNKHTNSKFLYVSFKSSGEVMTAVLGGHVDVGVFNPIECIGQIEAGKIIPIATYSKKRIPGIFRNVPTFTELGYKELQLTEVRAIAAPPGIPAAALKFYENMLKKVTETEKWKKDYLEKNYLIGNYMNAAETKKFFEGQIVIYKKIFSEVGAMQKK